MSATYILHLSIMFYCYLGKKPSIPVIGATNRVNSIDPAFLSRLGVPVEVPLPNDVSFSFLRVYIGKRFSRNGRLFLMTIFTDAGKFLFCGKSLVAMLR